MKISQLTMHYFPPTGGQDTYVQQLLDLLNEKEVEATVLQPAKTSLKAPQHVHYLPRIPFLGKLFVGANWFYFNGMLALKKKFLSKQDLLIVHYPFHLTPVKKHKKNIVISHGVDWPDEAKNIFDRAKKKSAKEAISLTKKNVIVVANDTEFLRKMGFSIQPATNYYQEVVKNVWFIPNTVDLKEFKRDRRKRKKYILVPRNIRKSRGIDLAIRAFLILNSKKEYQDYQLLIAGGPLKGSFYQKCLNLATNNKNIKFLGNLSQKELKKIYAQSMLTLIPTRAYEGTSLSALESMAVGTPVVSSKIGGLKDLPTHHCSLNPNKMAKALMEVIKKQNEYSEKQYCVVSKKFNKTKWNQTWKKVLNL